MRVRRREAIHSATFGLTLGDVGCALGSDEGVGVGGVANHEHLHGLRGHGVKEVALEKKNRAVNMKVSHCAH